MQRYRMAVVVLLAAACGAGEVSGQEFPSEEARKSWNEYSRKLTEAEREYLAKRKEIEKAYVDQLRGYRKQAIEKDDVDLAQKYLMAEKAVGAEPVPANVRMVWAGDNGEVYLRLENGWRLVEPNGKTKALYQSTRTQKDGAIELIHNSGRNGEIPIYYRLTATERFLGKESDEKRRTVIYEEKGVKGEWRTK